MWVNGELFSWDPMGDEADRLHVPLNTFTRTDEQQKFAMMVGCTEGTSGGPGRGTEELGPEHPGLEQETRRQAVNDIRRFAARLVRCTSERVGIAIDPTKLIETLTNEIIGMPDIYETYNSETALGESLGGSSTGVQDGQQLSKAIDRDMNLYGPDMVMLIVAPNDTRGATRKFHQGARETADPKDLKGFLRDNPEPVQEIVGEKKTESWTSVKRTIRARSSPTKAERKPKAAKQSRSGDATRTPGADNTVEALTNLLGGRLREGETLVDAVKRLVASGQTAAPDSGAGKDSPQVRGGNQPQDDRDEEPGRGQSPQ
ncbi:hypothetical protein KVR01_000108 [Diaporthe batatas]|uniref:uncharacterized protein n=1 Tax=Diaporthe batatas TaxID=748121 RepID=UPI001D036C07|nr:uncharacterized protein KVR01_000108 [Diaporthe batatas]KAG8169363.1 hypothetical protein KVR01_000108 [Diaporthe batatas]